MNKNHIKRGHTSVFEILHQKVHILEAIFISIDFSISVIVTCYVILTTGGFYPIDVKD